MKTIALTCRNCGKPLPEDSDPRRKYCPGTRCRQQFNEKLAKEKQPKSRVSNMRALAAAHHKGDPDIQEVKRRALDVVEDEIRDTMREVIKEEITDTIREKAQGAVAVMLDMLPKAMASLMKDMDSQDAVARRYATAIVMKYAMPTVQDNTKQTEDRSHRVYHFIPGPETPVGKEVQHQMDTTLVYDAENNFEGFEEDWEICARCGQRTPPDNMGHPHGKNKPPQCTSCIIRTRVERGDVSGSDYLNNPLYG